MTALDKPDVRPGQVWADNDPRAAGRHIRIDAVDVTHATVEACDSQGRRLLRARQTRIRLDRFRPTRTGYRLVSGRAGQTNEDGRERRREIAARHLHQFRCAGCVNGRDSGEHSASREWDYAAADALLAALDAAGEPGAHGDPAGGIR